MTSTPHHGSTSQSPAEEYAADAEQLLWRIRQAWVDPGQHVDYHMQCRRWLQEHWPTLADAVKDTVSFTSLDSEKDS